MRSQAPSPSISANNIQQTHPPTTQFFADSSRATTASYAQGIAAYERERQRKSKERYRTKQRQLTTDMEIYNHRLEKEIEQLQRTRDVVLAGDLATKRTVWCVAAEYFRVFQRGLPAVKSARTIGLDFLEATMDPELDAGTVQGLEALAWNWTVFTHFFTDVQIQLGRLEQIAENALVATTTTIITITSSSLSNIFPHLTNYGVDLGKANDWSRIAAKLLNQRLVMRGSVHFSWDSADSRVLRLITQTDMVTPLLRVLGNFEDVSRVFSHARINPDCNLVVDEYSMHL
ncbi:hypothetical protein V7S43_009801 [Phytophthora oleae]|uniref:Bzip transcription factor n=1 Tax=Phytophthora oleae TaxID=2107226 RepID=A0ABD3FFJ3_9STRA